MTTEELELKILEPDEVPANSELGRVRENISNRVASAGMVSARKLKLASELGELKAWLGRADADDSDALEFAVKTARVTLLERSIEKWHPRVIDAGEAVDVARGAWLRAYAAYKELFERLKGVEEEARTNGTKLIREEAQARAEKIRQRIAELVEPQ